MRRIPPYEEFVRTEGLWLEKRVSYGGVRK